MPLMYQGLHSSGIVFLNPCFPHDLLTKPEALALSGPSPLPGVGETQLSKKGVNNKPPLGPEQVAHAPGCL